MLQNLLHNLPPQTVIPTNLSDLGERVAVGGVAAVPELADAVGADHGPAAPQRLVPVERAAAAPVIDGGQDELKIFSTSLLKAVPKTKI